MAGHGETVGKWRKSSRSGDGNCVEIQVASGMVLVRDSKDQQGTVLTFTYSEWRAFLAGAHDGEFDVPPSE